MGIERKVPRKKIKVFAVKILLSSCSLVGLFMLICKLKLRKKKMKSFKVFSGWVFEVEIAICWKKVKLVGRRVD